MVFLDESMFDETTGWRLTAWTPIGHPARYSRDLNRGHAWGFLAAYTTKGYLAILSRRDYFNTESFYSWLVDKLLPSCRPYPEPNSMLTVAQRSLTLFAREGVWLDIS